MFFAHHHITEGQAGLWDALRAPQECPAQRVSSARGVQRWERGAIPAAKPSVPPAGTAPPGLFRGWDPAGRTRFPPGLEQRRNPGFSPSVRDEPPSHPKEWAEPFLNPPFHSLPALSSPDYGP